MVRAKALMMAAVGMVFCCGWVGSRRAEPGCTGITIEDLTGGSDAAAIAIDDE